MTRLGNTFVGRGLVRSLGFVRCAVIMLVCAAAALPLSAQTRLEQLEATYQANLRTIHAPILQEYVRQLELLKNKYAARGQTEEAKRADEELVRIKAIATNGGVLPYTTLEAAAAPPPVEPGVSPAPAPSPPPSGKAPALPTLLAAEAFKSGDMNTKTSAIPLGTAEWRIYKLPAGTYDVLVIFSSEALPLPEEIKVNLGGYEAKGSITSERATGSVETFRLHRLCQIKLDSEVSASTLTLTAASQDKPAVWVKKLIFAKPKPAVTASTAVEK